MNKVRRQELSKCLSDLETIKDVLENIRYDEEEYFNNMPENLQSSQRGIDSEDAIDKMNDAVSAIEEAVGYVIEII